MEVIKEEMWCFECDGVFITEDYFQCKECPLCGNIKGRLYRTSSFGFFYAYLERHPEEQKKINEGIEDAKNKMQEQSDKKT